MRTGGQEMPDNETINRQVKADAVRIRTIRLMMALEMVEEIESLIDANPDERDAVGAIEDYLTNFKDQKL
jgi:hypothetical protein